MMIKSMKVMLLPNNKQASKMKNTADAARYAYNWTIGKQMDSFEKTGKYIGENEMRQIFTKHKHEKAWLYNVSNNAAKQSVKDCCSAFDRFLLEKKKPNYKPYSKKQIEKAAKKEKQLTRYDMQWHPKFKKKGKATPKFYMDTEKIEFTKTHVRLEKISDGRKRNRTKANYVKLAEKDRVPVGGKYTNPRVTYDGIHWWISVGVSIEEEPIVTNVSDNDGIGIDAGIKDLAICSDGSKYGNINKTERVRKLKKKQRRLQRKISRKYEKNKEGGSYRKTSNIAKSEKQLLKVSQRLTGIRHNHVHQTTSKIIKQKPSFVVTEDLNVRGMMKNRHLSKAIQEQCLYEFSRQIEYKSHWNGIRFIEADRHYPSSKECSECGKIKKDLKLSERLYKCECGNEIDRDYQASINLKRYGEKQIVSLYR